MATITVNGSDVWPIKLLGGNFKKADPHPAFRAERLTRNRVVDHCCNDAGLKLEAISQVSGRLNSPPLTNRHSVALKGTVPGSMG